jgi:hypothetical protein
MVGRTCWRLRGTGIQEGAIRAARILNFMTTVGAAASTKSIDDCMSASRAGK